MRVLVVAARYPWPPRRGDQLRALQCCEALAGRHQVTLLVPKPARGATAPPRALSYAVETFPARRTPAVGTLVRHLRHGLPLQNLAFSYRHLEARMRELSAAADVVLLQLVRLAQFTSAVAPPAALVVDLVDSLSANFRLRAQRDRSWLAPVLRWEARRLAVWEERLVTRARVTMVVAERDRRELAGRLSEPLRRRLRTVPIAVEPRAHPAGPRREETLVFSGNLGYFVNRDALEWFLERVWPRLLEVRRSLRLLCAGSRAPLVLRRKIEAAGGELIEDPPDLPGLLAEATIALAPMQCGSGVPVKVLEAWAAGTAVVASPLAAEGIADPGAVEIAAEPEHWKTAILGLLADPDRRTALAAAGRSLLEREHSFAALSRRLEEALQAGLEIP